MGGGLVAGFASLMATSAEAHARGRRQSGGDGNAVNRFAQTGAERQLEKVYDARWKGVTKVRQQQRTWLLATRKYPDFIGTGSRRVGQHLRLARRVSAGAERAAPGRWTLRDGVHVHDLAAPVGSETPSLSGTRSTQTPKVARAERVSITGALAGLAAQHREQHQRAISATLKAMPECLAVPR